MPASLRPRIDLRLCPAFALAFLPAAAALAGWLPGWTSAVTPMLSFAVTHALVPAVRPERRQLVTPTSILYAGFAIQLVAAPALFLVIGPVPWVFPVAQTWHGIELAALVVALSFPCWALGLVAFERFAGPAQKSTAWGHVPRSVIALFFAIGVGGLALFAVQTNGGGITVGGDGVSGGAVTVARLVLRPFLAVAGVALLSNALVAGHRGLRDRRTRAVLGGCLLLLIVVSNATADVRRAPMLAALLALLAAWWHVTRRSSLRTLVLLGVGATATFFAVRVLRATGQPFNTLFNATGAHEGALGAFNTEVQSYAGGLQMIAFLVDHIHALGGFLHGRGQLYTAIAPLPQVGEPIRASTPGALYNALFIQRDDQVLPLAGQLYFEFGAVSVGVGFSLLGAISGALQRAFAQSTTLIEAFVWTMPSAWLAFSLGSSTVGFYQSLVYFSLPSYVLIALSLRRRLRRNRPAPGGQK